MKRELKRQQIGTYESIFTYTNLYKSFYSCRNGVRWKASIQKTEALLPLNTLKLKNQMESKKHKKINFYEFNINERGKTRHIMAEGIDHRCCQKCLCEQYLNKLLLPKLIYDNSASIKGKGPDFQLRRLKVHLMRHYKKYGNTGYILQFDFSKYFDNINHNILLNMLQRDIPDKNIYNYVKSIIDSFGDRGLGLGSQVSQICAVYYPNQMDRYFKQVLKISGYGRYMDDGYIICKDLSEVNRCKVALEYWSNKLDLPLNYKKVTVTKLNNTFIFLKKRIRLLDTGKIIIKLGRKNIHRNRIKLKKLFKKDKDLITLTNIYKMWYSQSKRYDNYYVTKNYHSLFNKYKINYNSY